MILSALQSERSPATWWLRVASISPRLPQRTIQERELARRSDLIAWLTLGLLIGTLLLALIALDDLQAFLALTGLALGLILAIVLNRSGLVTLAGILLVTFIAGAIWAYMLSSPLGLTMGQLPNYDLLAVTVVVAASILPRQFAFIVAAINCALIVADYLLRPHNANVATDAALYSSVTQQTISLLVRPIVLNLLLAIVAYLWVRGTDRAIARADRAEELAAIEYRELERTRTLEEGVRYVRQTVDYWARGDLQRRIPAMPVPLLQEMSDDLNAFIVRFTTLTNAEYQLYRLQGEVANLTIALDQWARGGSANWPIPSGTALDRTLEILAEMRRRAALERSGVTPRSAPRTSAPPQRAVSPGDSAWNAPLSPSQRISPNDPLATSEEPGR